MRRQDAIGAVCAASAAIIVGSSVAASSLISRYPPLASQAARY